MRHAVFAVDLMMGDLCPGDRALRFETQDLAERHALKVAGHLTAYMVYEHDRGDWIYKTVAFDGNLFDWRP